MTSRIITINMDLVRAFLAPLMLAACLILGGSETSNSIATLVCRLIALVLLAFELLVPHTQGQKGPNWGLYLLLSVFFLALLQLVPLPPGMWQALAGRDIIIDTLSITGLPIDSYRPLTFDPVATTASAMHLLPAIALMITTSRLGLQGQKRQLQLLILITIVGLFISMTPAGRMFDLALGETPRKIGRFEGFFSNQNHQADLQLIAMACCACLYAKGGQATARQNVIYLLLACGFIVGILGNGSRMGVALVVPVVAACLVLILRGQTIIRETWPRIIMLAAGAIAAIIWATSPFILPRVLGRLNTEGLTDLRWTIWNEVIFAIQAFFPAGTGLGTFQQIYETSEPLDQLSATFVNNAHNEYLQGLLEAGLIGTILLFAAFAWFVAAANTAWRTGSPMARTATIVISIYIVHSLVDYPLRTIAHSALLGSFMAFLPLVRFALKPQPARPATG